MRRPLRWEMIRVGYPTFNENAARHYFAAVYVINEEMEGAVWMSLS